MTPETHTFDDDGGIPNSTLPVLIYHGALGPSAGAAAYDVLVLSAGTGQRNVGSSSGLLAVGVYPHGMREREISAIPCRPPVS